MKLTLKGGKVVTKRWGDALAGLPVMTVELDYFDSREMVRGLDSAKGREYLARYVEIFSMRFRRPEAPQPKPRIMYRGNTALLYPSCPIAHQWVWYAATVRKPQPAPATPFEWENVR